MTQPYRFRHANQIAGAFVLLTVILAVAAVVVIGRAQHWFTPRATLHLDVSTQQYLDLRNGAEVVWLGRVIGDVTRIRRQPSGLLVDIRIASDALRDLGSDADICIQRSIPFMGSLHVIVRSEGASGTLTPGSTLRCALDLPERDIETAVKNAARVSEDLRTLAAFATQQRDKIQTLVNDAVALSSDLKNGQGILRQLLTDKSMANDLASSLKRINTLLDELNTTIATLAQSTQTLTRDVSKDLSGTARKTQETLDDLRKTMASVQKTTDALPHVVENIRKTTEVLPEAVLQTQGVMRQWERLLEGLQDHWLLRSSMDRSDRTRKITPEEAGGGLP